MFLKRSNPKKRKTLKKRERVFPGKDQIPASPVPNIMLIQLNVQGTEMLNTTKIYCAHAVKNILFAAIVQSARQYALIVKKPYRDLKSFSLFTIVIMINELLDLFLFSSMSSSMPSSMSSSMGRSFSLLY